MPQAPDTEPHGSTQVEPPYRYGQARLWESGWRSKMVRRLSHGAPGTLEWVATERLSFSGKVAFNRARYESFPNAQCDDETPRMRSRADARCRMPI
jgi:hypothetical protein